MLGEGKKYEGMKDAEVDQLLKSSNMLDRFRAVEILEERREVDKLIALLFSESWHLREKVHEALGRIAQKDDAEKLIPLLDEKVWYVRAGAIKVLGAMALRKELQDDIFELIYPHLKEKNEVVRTASAEILARLTLDNPSLKEKLSKEDLIVIENSLRENELFDLLEKFMNL